MHRDYKILSLSLSLSLNPILDFISISTRNWIFALTKFDDVPADKRLKFNAREKIRSRVPRDSPYIL